MRHLALILGCLCSFSSAAIIYDSTNRSTLTLVQGATDGGYVEGPFDQALFWQPQGGTMIRGTSVAVVADTANQVIRGVDFASKTTFHIAGTPTAMGNCLDETCPLDTFVDGMGNHATLTMPYSVSMHPHQRHAFISDTRSNAIRKVDLYTGVVHTVMKRVGYPTDVVCWDDWVAFSTGINHSIWVYRGITDEMLGTVAGDPPWAGAPQLLSGANNPLQGQYVEGEASAARFWEPLGLAYNPQEGTIYVADFRNRVIREVDPVTGFTARRVGRNDIAASIVDGVENAVLAGPTSLAYHAETGAVYFSDRNPDEDMGAIRVWYVGSTGAVRTLVGQSTRRTGNGVVTSGLVGVSAAWGVFVIPGGWVGWAETDTNSIRVVGPTGTTPCGVGEYHSSTLGTCTPCNNVIPQGTTYIATSPTSTCPWRCPDPPYSLPFICPPPPPAPIPGGALAVNSQGDQVVVCDPGLEKPLPNSTYCQLCAPGFYCTGLNQGQQACPPNTTSGPGSTSCYCSPGFVGSSQNASLASDSCTQCPMGYYCPGGNITLQCPDGLDSPPGASSLDDCTQCTSYKPLNSIYLPNATGLNRGECPWECIPGYYNLSGTCTQCYEGPCTTGEYLAPCSGQQDSYCTPCTNKPSGPSSEYTGNGTCTWRCTNGYSGSSDTGNCTPCSDGPCPAGFYRFPCPAGSTQDLGCTPCSAGPLFSTLGVANPYNMDACEITCTQGWHLLQDTNFCCSDASNLVDGGLACTCSAGFRVGWTGVDGADCVP